MAEQQILISEFKAKCIALMKEVSAKGQPLVVTLRGRPLVRIEPVSGESGERRLGAQADSITLRGNVLQPTFPMRQFGREAH